MCDLIMGSRGCPGHRLCLPILFPAPPASKTDDTPQGIRLLTWGPRAAWNPSPPLLIR